MNDRAFYQYLRSYGALAQRFMRDYSEPVKAFTIPYWESASEGISNPSVLEAIAGKIAADVARNYSRFAPGNVPTEQDVIDWLLPPTE